MVRFCTYNHIHGGIRVDDVESVYLSCWEVEPGLWGTEVMSSPYSGNQTVAFLSFQLTLGDLAFAEGLGCFYIEPH